jgi:hypothetical protein
VDTVDYILVSCAQKVSITLLSQCQACTLMDFMFLRLTGRSAESSLVVNCKVLASLRNGRRTFQQQLGLLHSIDLPSDILKGNIALRHEKRTY